MVVHVRLVATSAIQKTSVIVSVTNRKQSPGSSAGTGNTSLRMDTSGGWTRPDRVKEKGLARRLSHLLYWLETGMNQNSSSVDMVWQKSASQGSGCSTFEAQGRKPLTSRELT